MTTVTDAPGVLAPYMYWAKTRAATEFDLAASNMLACTLDDLEGWKEALQLTAQNDEGYAPLLEQIAALYGATPDRVMTAPGASGANFLVIATHVRPGQTVLLETPGYDPIAGACRLLGANVRTFERRADRAFAVDPDAIRAALTPDTALVIITSPHNPSGATLNRETLVALDALAAETRVPILVDEAYLDIARLLQPDPERFPRAAAVSERLISTSSLTKSYGLNGLRCGWAVMPAGGGARLRRTRDVVDGVGSAPLDRLATLAFAQLDRLGERARQHVVGNVALLLDFLSERPEFELLTPPDATIFFPRVQGLKNTDALCERAARQFGVTVVPGRFFGAPSHLRISAAGPQAPLAAGLGRLAEAMRSSMR